MPTRRTDHDLARKLGARIRQLREEVGLTQEKLAWDCDLSKGYMSRVEAGRHVPALEVLARIADRLGCELADLVALDLSNPRLAALERTRRAPV
jgi:transcriptional regulator with XRE-family HTH domain